jgi:hypothetical protein
MTIDYRGLRLIEQVLQAEERRDDWETGNESYKKQAVIEVERLFGLLCDWLRSRDSQADNFSIKCKANELLDQFRV